MTISQLFHCIRLSQTHSESAERRGGCNKAIQREKKDRREGGEGERERGVISVAEAERASLSAITSIKWGAQTGPTVIK